MHRMLSKFLACSLALGSDAASLPFFPGITYSLVNKRVTPQMANCSYDTYYHNPIRDSGKKTDGVYFDAIMKVI